MSNPWLSDDDQRNENLRHRAREAMEAWKLFYPEAAPSLTKSDEFTRLRAAMRDLWREL